MWSVRSDGAKDCAVSGNNKALGSIGHHLPIKAGLKPCGQGDAGCKRLLSLEHALECYVAALREASHCYPLSRDALGLLLLYLLLCTTSGHQSQSILFEAGRVPFLES